MTIYNEEEIIHLREGGKRLAAVLDVVENMVAPGVTTAELNARAEELIRAGGDVPAFLNYRPEGAPTPYPASLCVSVNDEIVHGIPGTRVIEDGDIVGIDLGLVHNGLFVDSARTVIAGEVSDEIKALVKATERALYAGIDAARGGSRIGDIGHAIEAVAKEGGFGVPEELTGHGVGHHVHEDPYVPNWGNPGTGGLLKPGLVLALEPMFNIGSEKILLDTDGHTFKTRDGSVSAHFEHTIVITDGAPEILTQSTR